MGRFRDADKAVPGGGTTLAIVVVLSSVTSQAQIRTRYEAIGLLAKDGWIDAATTNVIEARGSTSSARPSARAVAASRAAVG